jgi:hypothetical protein
MIIALTQGEYDRPVYIAIKHIVLLLPTDRGVEVHLSTGSDDAITVNQDVKHIVSEMILRREK